MKINHHASPSRLPLINSSNGAGFEGRTVFVGKKKTRFVSSGKEGPEKGQQRWKAFVDWVQLRCPGLLLWLDFEQLDSVGKLEKSVRESATFVVFLSKGYFASKNCKIPPAPPLPTHTQYCCS